MKTIQLFLIVSFFFIGDLFSQGFISDQLSKKKNIDEEEVPWEDPSFPGSWPMSGKGNVRMKIGGYMKNDFVYDVNGTRDKTQFLMSTIPVKGEADYGSTGYVSFFSKETRINLDVRSKVSNTPVQMFVEGDFFSSTGNQFRMRHAYLKVGKFTFGQTWTNLTFLETLPFIIDFAAGDALFGGRSNQIRYETNINKNWLFGASIEYLENMGIENPNTLNGVAQAQLPLLSMKFIYSKKNTKLFFGASAAQLNWTGGPEGKNASTPQLDIIFGGRRQINRKNSVSWNVNYGIGSGENILAFIGSNANAVLTQEGELVAMKSFSALVGYTHHWNEKWSSNFSYAYGWLMDIPDSRDPFALKAGGISHINLVWQPLKYFSTGIEYMRGTQRTANSALGTANRFQLMTKFDF
ncbi:hypothetical protein KMW28_02835 [Flammeovirga yaeyamensis]|uniref:Porin n=1 Tax=Flammeovirga yaeyamensis TaxID=367791 RepID=A0AAX1N921_9BACT|nr:DcaP family trimeric outer membrane transporter [Flammeovirga yaeyamensis]MBB3700449.1 hypothetical protein [Flammeovirga yaeyamensis]NMF36927.1 hypothetical protein [Flammeovirga yaeyamensis]QWG02527.1 hypothetical protein KMW28_02835 [Flammeovirga yaeyamensis]